MVQIKLFDNEKENVGSVTDLLPTTNPEFRRRVEISPKRTGTSFTTTLMVILSIIFAVSALKQICDLKEQNIRLMQQLAFERQKDAALKLAVRDNIPENKFSQHRFNSVEAGLVEAEGKVDQPSSTWTINLSVLWTSPLITPCDMARLSHVLAEEIYAHQEERMNTRNPWTDEIETYKIIDKEEDLALANLFQSETTEESSDFKYWDDITDSSKESSEELTLDNGLLDSLINEDLDYFLSEAAIWDDSEEFELFGDDSTEATYYDYYQK